MKNDFKTDTNQTGKKEFLHRMGGVFTCAIFLTGLCSAGGVYFLIRSIWERPWEEMGAAGFAWKAFLYLVMICAFVSLIKIAIDEKPFSRTLTYCVRVIGGLFVTAALLMPRLQGYEPSGFEILHFGNVTLIDGFILLPGLLLLILSSLIETGFTMQKEMDEIL